MFAHDIWEEIQANKVIADSCLFTLVANVIIKNLYAPTTYEIFLLIAKRSSRV